MEKLFLSFAFLCLVSGITAQICVKKDSTGNFVYSEKPVYCDSITGMTLTLKDGKTKIPVYITSGGSYYIISDSKKYRRIYLNQK